ncbi:ABC transporter substrate-binding protein [Prauserella sp. PE36]|uniref:ABC transporter substrate-binding protein n=1 Tax=Prauserella sp. PE36 TaxID=1504709 RepID=UPI001314F6C3|nr:ABC transporter substrate-binding protein [Prauserella sp. PE36]
MKQFARGLVAASAAVALVGCGTSSGQGPGDGITVVTASSNPTISGTVALGIAKGTFDEAGVEVNLELGEGSQAVNTMVAGRADLTESSATSASSLEVGGKDISAVWASAGGGLGLKLFTAADGPKTVEEFETELADGCSAGVTAPGSSGYGYMLLLKEELGLDCELVELGDTAQILGAMISGRVDTMLSTSDDPALAAAVQAGEVNIVLDMAKRERITELGIPQFPDRIFFGLKRNLDGKRDAMVAFASGMKEAANLYASMDAEEIADAILSIEVLATEFPTDEDRTGLIASIKESKPFVNWTDGHIAEKDWNNLLSAAADWEIDGFDAADPKRSYANIVDMSFYNAAE